ncbi:MAG: nucleotide pyrophosphatase [Planctomycetes bacterium]|nr:nucleotide pyrophosphatase [Planctomycetota bacterium]
MARSLKLRLVLATLFAVVGFGPATAHGYIGPGAGIAAAGAVFVVAFALLAAFAALLILPVRMTIRWFKTSDRRARQKAKRVVIVGMDGMDPELTTKWMAEGKLPNLKKLADEGIFRPLSTATPSMSPVAWSSFMTGVDPGKHGIFDFITRDTCTYMPMLSSAKIAESETTFGFGAFKKTFHKSFYRMLRRSQPFWKILGENWVSSSIQRVPITFPPEKFKNGVLLSGMCVPDLKGSQGSFSFFTTKMQGRLQDETAGMGAENAGGTETEVKLVGGVIDAAIEGPSMGGKKLACPFKLTLDADRKGATLVIGKEKVALRLGEYSPWLKIEYPGLHGIARFYLQQADPEVELYVTPVHIDPANPILPISEPQVYSAYLAKIIGPFGTLGLAEDTWALNERRIDEAAFLKQAYLYAEEREAMFWDAVAKTRSGFITTVFDTTDRIQHMFFRYLDPKHPANVGKDTVRHKDAVEDVYRWCDQFVGRARAKVADKDTVFVVMSDHGFKQFQRGVNLNAWLRDRGWLVLKDGKRTGGDWFESVDWSRTKAFSMGLTGIFINRKGREVKGIVEDGDELHRLKNEIADALRQLVDSGRGGVRAVREVFDTQANFAGPYSYEAPDLLIGYEAGYRHSWDCAVGCTSENVFSDNTKSWSGDHCMDPRIVPGVFFCDRKINTETPNILDLAPTVLDLFGIQPPPYMQGERLFGERKPKAPAGPTAKPAPRVREPITAAH